ncbi:hypothetical protein B0H19DRAFT_333208 [Mycena capillaripes]|nr:hypothetical protein B0H19DRAFT_333208 [Mycena capillaripes]
MCFGMCVLAAMATLLLFDSGCRDDVPVDGSCDTLTRARGLWTGREREKKENKIGGVICGEHFSSPFLFGRTFALPPSSFCSFAVFDNLITYSPLALFGRSPHLLFTCAHPPRCIGAHTPRPPRSRRQPITGIQKSFWI